MTKDEFKALLPVVVVAAVSLLLVPPAIYSSYKTQRRSQTDCEQGSGAWAQVHGGRGGRVCVPRQQDA